MIEQNPAHATVSLSCVYLKQKGTNSALSTRIPFPTSVDSLMKTAERLYGNVMTVVSLLTEDGHRIDSVDDIVPGSTVLVSSCDAAGESPVRNFPSPVAKKGAIMSADSFARLFGANESQCHDVTETEPGVFSFADRTTPKKEPRQKPKFVSRRPPKKVEEDEAPADQDEGQGAGSARRRRRHSRMRGRSENSPERSTERADAQASPGRDSKASPKASPGKDSRASPKASPGKDSRASPKSSPGRDSRASPGRGSRASPGRDSSFMSQEESDQDARQRLGQRKTKEQEGPKCRLQPKPRIQMMIEEDERAQGLSGMEDEAPKERRRRHRRHRKQEEDLLSDGEDTEEQPSSSKKGFKIHHRKSRKADDSELQTTDELADDESEQVTPQKKGIQLVARKSKPASPDGEKAGTPKRTMVLQRRSDKSPKSFTESEQTTEEPSEELATPKRRHRKHRKVEADANTTDELDEQSEEKGSMKMRRRTPNKAGDSERRLTDEISFGSEEKTASATKGIRLQARPRKLDKDGVESTPPPKRTMGLQRKSPTPKSTPVTESDQMTTDELAEAGSGRKGTPNRKKLALRPSASKSSAVSTPKSQAKASESYSDDSYYSESEEKPVRPQRSPGATHPEIIKAENMDDMFQLLVGESSIQGKIENAFENLPRYKDALKALPSMEIQHGTEWFEKLLEFAGSQGIEHYGDDTYGIDDMIGNARALLVDRRFNTGTSFSHRHNIGVIGPRQSGKSTFLSILTEEVLVDLAATDEWKKTFVFIADLNRVCALANDYAEFYHAIVALTCKLLEWQRPHFSKYLGMIQNYFNSITSLNCAPKFSKAFVVSEETRALSINLQKIADQLAGVWHDPNGLVSWLTSVISFPSAIAKAFDFRKTLTILDHFDASDVVVTGSPDRFEDSKEVAFLADVFKFVTKNDNFILACQDQSHFYSILPSISGDVNCTLSDIELVSTIGLVPSQGDNRQFLVSFTGETSGYPFTVEACGGIPYFLQIWEELHKLYDEVEKGDGDSDEKQIQMNAYMQEFMKILFQITTGEEKFEVLSITRTTRKSKSK